jgi:hypothetical protein
MSKTDINGTYEYMYLVTPNEKAHGVTYGWDLTNGGSGSAAVNPVATGVTISGAPNESGSPDSGTFDVSVGGSDNFVFVDTAETTTFGRGFIVEDKASGQYYFITNTAFTGAKNPASSSLSVESTTPPPAPLCFLEGTRIATADGDVEIQNLQRGDLVTTTDGETLPVLWIGRHTVVSERADPLRAFPVRIKAGALADERPSRDLLLSPDHAVLVDGVLVQAGALVNDASITRELVTPETFIYYHIELGKHALVWAENTMAETFVDNVDRMAFDNWNEHEVLFPNGNPIAEMALPRAKAYRQVPTAIRNRLSDRAVLLGLSSSMAA